MRKYKWLLIVVLIGITVPFIACQYVDKMTEPIMPEPDPEVTEPTPPETVEIDLTDPNALPNRLTVQGATLVSQRRPETSTAETAPSIQADVTGINASPGDTVNLPFEYSGTNTLGGCIVCIVDVPGYYDLPYTGAADALPTAIPVGIPANIGLGSFTVCYSVYDDQGQYGNYLTTVITVAAPGVTEPTPPEVVEIDLTDPNALPNRLTVQGGSLVSARPPATSTAATAPRVQADVSDISASPGDTVNLPFEYSGANALAGCIVCIEGVPGYYDLPYGGAADALPTAIPVAIPPNIGLGSFTVCYGVYDDQGQYANYLTAVITVAEPPIVVDPGDAPDGNLIRDPNLAAAVREELGLTADAPLTAAVLLNLQTLGARERGIADLTGLEYATNLERLDLGDNQLSDISALANLTKLKYLDLGDNQLSDISPLASLTNLITLYLGENSLSDISPLANLTKLEVLGLFRSQVSDISALANLTKLTRLGLFENPVSDISALANLTKLEVLGLSNQVSDISALSNLTNLTELKLNNNQISDISPIANLTKLTELNLYNNQTSDISPLANLTKLTELYLSYNQISDISPLANLTKLTRLDLPRNQISDISPLANLTKLTFLKLGENELPDISSLANLTKLTFLVLHNNQLSDISPLANLTSLTHLDLYNNQISDISPLVANTGLSGRVYLQGNPLNDAARNTHIPALRARGIDVDY